MRNEDEGEKQRNQGEAKEKRRRVVEIPLSAASFRHKTTTVKDYTAKSVYLSSPSSSSLALSPIHIACEQLRVIHCSLGQTVLPETKMVGPGLAYSKKRKKEISCGLV
jgi:hypothetical protein